MAATGNYFFCLADFKKSSFLKPLGQMNRNLVASIYGISSIEDFTMMLPTKFQFIWESSFRGEDLLEINQSETRMAYRLLISSPSVLNKHGCQRKFLFQVGRFLKIFPH
jgi:hypothetical protein